MQDGPPPLRLATSSRLQHPVSMSPTAAAAAAVLAACLLAGATAVQPPQDLQVALNAASSALGGSSSGAALFKVRPPKNPGATASAAGCRCRPLPANVHCSTAHPSLPSLPLDTQQAHDALWPALKASLRPLLAQDEDGARRRRMLATAGAAAPALPFPTLSEATTLVQQYGTKLLQLQALSAQQAFTNSVEVSHGRCTHSPALHPSASVSCDCRLLRRALDPPTLPRLQPSLQSMLGMVVNDTALRQTEAAIQHMQVMTTESRGRCLCLCLLLHLCPSCGDVALHAAPPACWPQ